MRIIGGIHKGKVIRVAKGLPVRPTTDFAKEGLFNILHNRMDLEGIRVLDLFSGTGHISLEFASRGSATVHSVDKEGKCCSFIKATAAQLDLNIQVHRSDVFSWLDKCTEKFDIIFADPPYDLANIPDICKKVMEKGLLNENGELIIEHGSRTDLSQLPGFVSHRKYGNVNFSFFRKASIT